MNFDQIKFLTSNSAMKMMDNFKIWSFSKMLQAYHNVLLEGCSPKWIKYLKYKQFNYYTTHFRLPFDGTISKNSF